jgi:hypothetical protein
MGSHPFRFVIANCYHQHSISFSVPPSLHPNPPPTHPLLPLTSQTLAIQNIIFFSLWPR